MTEQKERTLVPYDTARPVCTVPALLWTSHIEKINVLVFQKLATFTGLLSQQLLSLTKQKALIKINI